MKEAGNMTIKEIENLTGMTRANIRFYETEGLIHPSRNTNGYRDYTEEDMASLQRIRLLRTLHISLEDIRALTHGEKELTDTLLSHLVRLKNDETDLEQCREICEKICSDHPDYRSLDAVHYLTLMAALPDSAVPELQEDSLPKVTAPWKRLLARWVDFGIYSLIWNCILAVGMHVNIRAGNIGTAFFFWLFQIIFLLLLEPVMLSLTGTTPGKFLFGLSVTDPEGTRLTRRAALRRTWAMLRYGYGFLIPVYELFRMYRSYKGCKKEEVLEWESDSVLVLRNRPLPLLTAGFVVSEAVFCAASLLFWQMGSLPENHGELTVAEFCENYNQLQQFYGIDQPVNIPDTLIIYLAYYPTYPMLLDEYGEWMHGAVWQSFGNTYGELPQLQFETEGDQVTGVSFSMAYENEDVDLVLYDDFMAVSVLSYLCAQDGYSLLSMPPCRIYEQIRSQAADFRDFTFSAAGVTVTCEREISGYRLENGGEVLVPEYGKEPVYRLEFSMYRSGI